MDEKLRPTERIQTSSEFRRVFKRGRYFSSPAIRIHYLPTSRELSRLGLVVSRRRGKAHVRSRIKRLLREVFRRQKLELPAPHDIVLIPRDGPREFEAYRDSFASLVAHLKARSEAPGTRQPSTRGRGPRGRSLESGSRRR
ncbi:MAG: ribonuclease P protein component [Planctomycetota bacterium]|nr:ribonuclease P protein component [Planctomycetota bacterium]